MSKKVYTHYTQTNVVGETTACGTVIREDLAMTFERDGEDQVTCGSCRGTKAYREVATAARRHYHCDEKNVNVCPVRHGTLRAVEAHNRERVSLALECQLSTKAECVAQADQRNREYLRKAAVTQKRMENGAAKARTKPAPIVPVPDEPTPSKFRTCPFCKKPVCGAETEADCEGDGCECTCWPVCEPESG